MGSSSVVDFFLRFYLMGDHLGSPGVVDFYLLLLYLNVNNITDPLKLRSCLRPYHGEITGSCLISKVKHRRAWVVLEWVTTWEVLVL